MTDPFSGSTQVGSQVGKNPDDQKMSWILAIAERAKAENWTPTQSAAALLMMGLESHPVVRRVLVRHGHLAADPALDGIGEGTSIPPRLGARKVYTSTGNRAGSIPQEKS